MRFSIADVLASWPGTGIVFLLLSLSPAFAQNTPGGPVLAPPKDEMTVKVQNLSEPEVCAEKDNIDIRFSKRFTTGPLSFEPTLDIFNLLNANTVLLQNETIGTSALTGFTTATWARPTRILAPRIFRVGITARF